MWNFKSYIFVVDNFQLEPQVLEIWSFILFQAFHSAISSSESVRLTYSLIAPAHIDELPFEIHEQSGEVSTSRPLDTEQKKFYRFQVSFSVFLQKFIN